MWWRSVIFHAVTSGIILTVAVHALWLLSWIIGKLAGWRIHYAPFGWTALALVLFFWVLFAYGHYFGRYRYEVNRITFSHKALPRAFSGLRIIHISDLHVDSYLDRPEALDRIVDAVNAEKADIICFTGDLTTGPFREIEPFIPTLRRLKAKEGVVSILGNHDFFIYSPEYHNDRERSAAADLLTRLEEDSLGWRVVRNSSIMLRRGGDSIAVAGVDNINGGEGFATIQKGDLGRAIEGLEGVFTVMMTHDPSHWRAEVLPRSEAQLTLSGHTHAAQFRILGWSLSNLFFSECDGRYDEGERTLYVNAGIGCTAPFRIDCPSEITVITLTAP